MAAKGIYHILQCLSPAALQKLFSGGVGEAKRIMAATFNAYYAQVPHLMDYWDFVRIFSVDAELKIPGGRWADGGISPLERLVLAQAVKFFAPQTILELGTFRGATTSIMLDNLPPGAKVYTVDLPPEVHGKQSGQHHSDEHLIKHRQVGVHFQGHPLADQVTQVFGDSLLDETWEQLPAGGIDFAFIDASHTYEAVKQDTERVLSRLSGNGVILWHDYDPPGPQINPERGVGRYLDELMAVDERVFVVMDTDMGVMAPRRYLESAAQRVKQFFPDGSYDARYPKGPTPWLA